jgi:hypothetical protein
MYSVAGTRRIFVCGVTREGFSHDGLSRRLPRSLCAGSEVHKGRRMSPSNRYRSSIIDARRDRA